MCNIYLYLYLHCIENRSDTPPAPLELMYTRTIGKQTIPIQNATLSHKGSLNTKHSPAQGQWYQERVRVSVSVIVYSVCILSDFSLDWSKVNSNLQWIPPCVLVDLKQRCQGLATLKKLSKVFSNSFDFWLVFTWTQECWNSELKMNLVFFDFSAGDLWCKMAAVLGLVFWDCVRVRMLHCKSHYHSVVEKHQRVGLAIQSSVTRVWIMCELGQPSPEPEMWCLPGSIMSRVWWLQGQQLIHHTLQTPDTGGCSAAVSYCR